MIRPEITTDFNDPREEAAEQKAIDTLSYYAQNLYSARQIMDRVARWPDNIGNEYVATSVIEHLDCISVNFTQWSELEKGDVYVARLWCKDLGDEDHQRSRAMWWMKQ